MKNGMPPSVGRFGIDLLFCTYTVAPTTNTLKMVALWLQNSCASNGKVHWPSCNPCKLNTIPIWCAAALPHATVVLHTTQSHTSQAQSAVPAGNVNKSSAALISVELCKVARRGIRTWYSGKGLNNTQQQQVLDGNRSSTRCNISLIAALSKTISCPCIGSTCTISECAFRKVRRLFTNEAIFVSPCQW